MVIDRCSCCSVSHLLPCTCNTDLLCCFRGFLRSDTLIGTANVKLQPLETTCEIHESFDVSNLSFAFCYKKKILQNTITCILFSFRSQLMDGRKTVGGKLEVKIRIRNPILSKQVVNESEKWLVLE